MTEDMKHMNLTRNERPSFLDYLPEIYRHEPGKQFPDRFIALFETLFYDLKEKTAGTHKYFHPGTAPADFIPWLAQWVSLDLYELLGDRNRDFILRAAEFYKQKGTVPGIAELVSLLTGKKCCVKEYMNNVFRTYGMEHIHGLLIETSPDEEEKCVPFYHKASTIVDTTDRSLLEKIGTYEDEVHYLTGTRKEDLYKRNVIGLFIFLSSEDKDFIIDEDELKMIIASFLPVFVQVEIFIVLEEQETYPLNHIIESFKTGVHGYSDEQFANVAGDFTDTTGWSMLYTCSDTVNGYTNHLDYRLFHSGIDVVKPL